MIPIHVDNLIMPDSDCGSPSPTYRKELFSNTEQDLIMPDTDEEPDADSVASAMDGGKHMGEGVEASKQDTPGDVSELHDGYLAESERSAKVATFSRTSLASACLIFSLTCIYN